MQDQGLALIESVLNPGGLPVLGLFIYTAAGKLLKSIRGNPDYRRIMPHLIGTPAIVSRRPGISQTELAALLGGERATAGLRVSQCVRRGWLRRRVSTNDRRKYVLHTTPAGKRMLTRVAAAVARHEQLIGASLNAVEREQLRSLLAKFIAGLATAPNCPKIK